MKKLILLCCILLASCQQQPQTREKLDDANALIAAHNEEARFGERE